MIRTPSPRGYLSANEFEAEFMVRLINSAIPDAKKLLMKRIESKNEGVITRHVNSHLTRNPDIEYENCNFRSQEFVKPFPKCKIRPKQYKDITEKLHK